MTEKPQTEVKQILDRFIAVRIIDILRPSYQKLALCRLRWALTDVGVSHYLLPEMPLMDYIRISESLECPLSCHLIAESAYYCILSARNILALLKKAYLFNAAVTDFLNMRIGDLLGYADSLNDSLNIIVPELIRKQIPSFKLTEKSTLLELVDAVAEEIEPVTVLYARKKYMCYLLTRGSCKSILPAYWLFRLVFSLSFIELYPEKFSAYFMKKNYRNVHFFDDFLNTFDSKLFDNA